MGDFDADVLGLDSAVTSNADGIDNLEICTLSRNRAPDNGK